MTTLPTPLIRTKTRGQQILEHRIGEPLQIALHRLYVIERRDQEEIGRQWGIEQSTVSRWLRAFGISRI
jgi:DNA-binding transcriptional regulator LsrR (DeoR family)